MWLQVPQWACWGPSRMFVVTEKKFIQVSNWLSLRLSRASPPILLCTVDVPLPALIIKEKWLAFLHNIMIHLLHIATFKQLIFCWSHWILFWHFAGDWKYHWHYWSGWIRISLIEWHFLFRMRNQNTKGSSWAFLNSKIYLACREENRGGSSQWSQTKSHSEENKSHKHRVESFTSTICMPKLLMSRLNDWNFQHPPGMTWLWKRESPGAIYA